MSRPSSRARPWIVSLATALTVSGVAAARATEKPRAAKEQDPPHLAEIVVTARGWRENLQRVPDSVSVFTQRVIEERGIRSIQDAVSYVPSVSFVNSQDAGLSNITVRGIGQVRNGEPPVAVVVDGVELSSPDEIKQVLDDVARIEVLKGPQGALYGRNALGGAIVIDTAKPSDNYTARVQAGAGNGAYRQTSGMLSGPLVPQLAAFRLTAGYSDFGGLIENVTLHQKVDFDTSKYARARLLLGKSLSDGGPWSLDIIGSWSKFEGGASYYIPLPDGEPNNTSIRVQAGQLGRSGQGYIGETRSRGGSLGFALHHGRIARGRVIAREYRLDPRYPDRRHPIAPGRLLERGSAPDLTDQSADPLGRRHLLPGCRQADRHDIVARAGALHTGSGGRYG